MEEYICPRCSFKTTNKQNFIKHINRVHMCKPTLSTNSLVELKDKYKVKKRTPKLDTSNLNPNKYEKDLSDIKNLLLRILSILDTKQDIISTSPPPPVISEPPVIPEPSPPPPPPPLIIPPAPISKTQLPVIAEVKSPTTQLQLQPAKSMPIPTSVPKIKLRDFGKEDILYLLENVDEMKKCFLTYEQGLVTFIKHVWFDEKHPDNQNFRVINAKTVEYYQQNKWIKASLKDHLIKLLDYIGGFYQQFLEKNEIFDYKFLNGYMKKIGVHLEWDLSHNDYDYVPPKTTKSICSNSSIEDNDIVISIQKLIIQELCNIYKI
jgi:uncharacterized C2H2 Zn-finger protein